MTSNCHISERLKGCCDSCHNWPARLHMPEDIHGWYCAQCCPACKAQPAASQPPATAQEAAPASQAA